MSQQLGLRGASADALAALTGELEQAVKGDADAAKVGDDLLAVSALLRGDASLRRVLTDVSVDAEAKKGLARNLLDGKIGAAALEVVTSAVSRRWTSSRDLGAALERLGEIAVVRSAGEETARLGDELHVVAQAVQENPELRDALSDPVRSREEKEGLLAGLLADKALPATVRLAKEALTGTYRTVTVALGEYQKVAAAVAGERVAKVRVARDLSESERTRLSDALSRQYGKSIHLNVVVEPDLVGGMRVEIGDDVIDGSVSARLDDARRRLAG